MIHSPPVSVIIPHFNDADRLARCLGAIEAQDYPGRIEILVVDNGSATTPSVSGRARLLHEERPGSYAARNRGLAEATGQVLAFTDSDCLPHPDWLSGGIRALLADPENGLIGGKVRIMAMSGDRANLAELFETAAAFPQDRYIAEGRYAATANMMTTRRVMDAVGPFDARLRSGGDADWGQRVAAAGYRLVYAPRAVIDHPARASHDELLAKLRRTVAGERDRRPHWGQALRFVIRHAVPPRRQVIASLAMPHTGIVRRLQVAAVCIGYNWMAAGYRVLLQLNRSVSSRV